MVLRSCVNLLLELNVMTNLTSEKPSTLHVHDGMIGLGMILYQTDKSVKCLELAYDLS